MKKLATLDSRIIFWIAVVFIIVPLLRPLALPLPISPYTRALHDFIVELPPDSVVGVAIDCSVGQWPSLEPGWVVLMKLMFSQDLKLIFWSMDSTGPRCFDLAIAEMPEFIAGEVYGVDYVTFGYIPGVESAVASLAADTWGTLGNDRRGTPVEDIPIMQNVKSARDFDAVFCYEQGVGTTMSYLRHWATAYDVPYILGTSPGGLMGYLRFYGVEVKGMMAGSQGAAEMEFIIKQPAKGLQMMDVQNIIHLLLLGAIIFGNLMYWASRSMESKLPTETTNTSTGG